MHAFGGVRKPDDEDEFFGAVLKPAVCPEEWSKARGGFGWSSLCRSSSGVAWSDVAVRPAATHTHTPLVIGGVVQGRLSSGPIVWSSTLEQQLWRRLEKPVVL
jgi:hypothetical protein